MKYQKILIAAAASVVVILASFDYSPASVRTRKFSASAITVIADAAEKAAASEMIEGSEIIEGSEMIEGSEITEGAGIVTESPESTEGIEDTEAAAETNSSYAAEASAVMTKTATVQAIIEKKLNAAVESEALYTPQQFRRDGVIYYNGFRFTYYSEKVLPGGGLVIPGRHVDEGGYVCDENNFICVASCDYPKGSVVETPFGKQGKVYDECPTSGTLDVYVSW